MLVAINKVAEKLPAKQEHGECFCAADKHQVGKRTVKVHCLDEADIVGVRAMQAQEVGRDVFIVAHLQYHAHMHLMPLDILRAPYTSTPNQSTQALFSLKLFLESLITYPHLIP